MANKVVLGVLLVIIGASFGVGTLVGMQIGGGVDAPADDAPTSDEPTEAPAAGGDGAGSSSTDVDETPTSTSGEQRTTVPPRQFDEAEIARYVVQFVNDERTERDLEELTTGGSTAESVRAMAHAHSVAMADEGEATHDVDGVDTAGRYKNDGLYDRCKFEAVDGNYIRQPNADFESLGLTKAGQHYEADGETQFNGDERAVARTIVDGWMESSEYSERVLIEGPSLVGVGVEVTDAGTVFVTADVCS